MFSSKENHSNRYCNDNNNVQCRGAKTTYPQCAAASQFASRPFATHQHMKKDKGLAH